MDFTAFDTHFEYLAAPLVQSVFPQIAVWNVSTEINICGKDFIDFSRMHCVVGNLDFDAISANNNCIQCNISGERAIIDTPLQVSLAIDNGKAVDSNFLFLFRDSPLLADFQPRIGSESGGWKVIIPINNLKLLSGVLTCRFSNSVIVSAELIVQTSVSCTVPQLPVGVAALEISYDNKTFYSLGQLTITPILNVLNYYPKFGVLSGGQLIYFDIVGGGGESARLCCEFDGIVHNSISYNSSTTVCKSPPSPMAVDNTVYVRIVECNAITAIASSSLAFPFNYVTSPLRIRSFYPSLGSKAGGTQILITGENIDPTSTFYCVFDGIQNSSSIAATQIAQFIDSSSLSCVSPPSEFALDVEFVIRVNSTNGEAVMSSYFTYFNDPVFSAIKPAGGVDIGGTAVSITLHPQFLHMAIFVKQSVSCYFGAIKSLQNAILTQFANSSAVEVSCISPPNLPGIADVYVSFNGFDLLPTGFTFTYIPAPAVHSVSPYFVTALTPFVSLYGTGFGAFNQICCGFGGAFNSGEVISDSRIDCGIPDNLRKYPISKSSNVTISIDCQQFIDTGISVNFIPLPNIVSVSPLLGYTNDNTVVIITANNLYPSNSNVVICRVNGIDVVAIKVSTEVASCLVPPLQSFNLLGNSSILQVPFDMSVDGGSTYFNAGRGLFFYVTPPVIVSFTPSLAFEGGEFVIKFNIESPLQTLGGFDLYNNALCRVGHQTAQLYIFSSKSASCTVSIDTVGNYSASLSLNGQDFVNSYDAIIRVVPRAIFKRMYPSSIFLSDSSAGISVEIDSNYAWTDSQSIYCMANGSAFEASLSVQNSNSGIIVSTITCHVSLKSSGLYSLRILTADGIDIVASLSFTAWKTPPISTIQPPVVNNAAPSTVCLIGLFEYYPFLNCLFAEQALGGANYSTAAVFSNSTTVCCEHDPSRALDSEFSGYSTVAVGLVVDPDAMPFIASYLTVLEVMQLKSLIPTTIAAGINFTVSVMGKNFVQTPDLHCRIGTYSFAAMVVNANQVNCLSVNIEVVGIYSFALSANDMDFIDIKDVHIQVQSLPEFVMSTELLSCPATGSSTGFKITGLGFAPFLDALQCVYDGISLDPISISNSSVTCPCPSVTTLFGRDSFSFDSNLSITIRGQTSSSDLLSSSLHFYPLPSATISTFNLVIVNVSTLVGISFAPTINSTAYCRTDPDKANAQVISQIQVNDSYLACEVLLSQEDAVVEVQVSLDSVFFFNAGYIHSIQQSKIVEIDPSVGSDEGGFSTTILVTNPIPYVQTLSTVACVFNSHIRVAPDSLSFIQKESTTFTRLTCGVPNNISVGNVDVSVVQNGFLSLPATITIFPTPNLLSQGPFGFSTNSLRNKIELQVSSNFPVGYPSYCMLNGSRLISSSASPSYVRINDDGSFAVFVSCDLTLFTLTVGYYNLSVGFLASPARGFADVFVEDDIFIHELSPSIGFLEGGTTIIVTISSASFSSRETVAFCLLDGVEYEGLLVDPSHIVCTTPPSSFAHVSLVTVRTDRRRSGNALTFAFVNAVKVGSIFPSLGSISGGTYVTVNAHPSAGFVPFVNYSCVFGATIVPASYLSTTQIVCATPTTAVAGQIAFNLLIGDSSVSVTDIPLYFNFFLEPKIVSLFPNSGPLYGGVNVTAVIVGPKLIEPYLKGASYWCKFGNQIISAFLLSTNTVTCSSPQSRTTGAVPFEVSLNAVDFFGADGNGSFDFSFSDAISITELKPWHIAPLISKAGFQHSISLYGQSFPNENDIVCVFGGEGDCDISTQNATYVSSNELLCTVDLSLCSAFRDLKGRSLPVSLHIGNKQVIYGPTIQIDKVLDIEGIYPQKISVSDINSGSYVTVNGKGFADFAEKACYIGTQTEAVIISETILLCKLPQIESPAIIDVSVTMNGVDIIQAGYLIVTSGLKISAVYPDLIPSSGYTNLRISAADLNPSYVYTCNVNGFSTVAIVESSTLLTCPSPPSIGPVISASSISISCVNISDFGLSNSLPLHYYSSPLEFKEIFPILGPSLGGTTITLTMANPLLVTQNVKVLVRMLSDNVTEASFDPFSNTISFVSLPSSHPVGEFSVSVNGGFDFHLVEFPFYFLPDIDGSISFSPVNLTVSTATTLRIVATFPDILLYSSDLSCRIGFETFPATVSLDSLILCDIIVRQVGVYSVSFSYNGQQWIDMGNVQVFNGVRLTSLSPIGVPVTGGVNVSLYGYEFNPNNDYEALIISADNSVYLMISTWFISESQLQFIFPPLESALTLNEVSLSLLSNGGNSNSLNLSIHQIFQIDSISPVLGFSIGNTPVTLLVDSMIPSYLSVVVDFYIDRSLLPSNPELCTKSIEIGPTVTGSELIFLTPQIDKLFCTTSDYESFRNQHSAHMNVDIRADNGYVTLPAFFTYLWTPTFFNLSINSIDEDYDQPIYVFGENIPQHLNITCIFDQNVVFAIEVTESYVVCPLPAVLVVGDYKIAIGLSDAVDWIEVPEKLSVGPAPLVLDWSPKFAPSRGFTNITITGLSLVELAMANSSTLFCKFGVLEMPANLLSNQSIVCKTPPRLTPGVYNITVIIRQIEGKTFKVVPASQPMYVTVYADESASTVSISHGPSIGGTVVVIEGQNFLNSNNLVVRFQCNDTLSITVTAVFISNQQLMITTPKNPAGAGSGMAMLSVSNNNYDFVSTNLIFYWDRSIVVSSVYPNAVFEASGNIINIAGEGFIPSFPNMLKCRFGGSMYSAALYINDKSISCAMPPTQVIKRSSLEVSNNGLDYTDAGFIDIVPVPQLLSISPSEV